MVIVAALVVLAALLGLGRYCLRRQLADRRSTRSPCCRSSRAASVGGHRIPDRRHDRDADQRPDAAAGPARRARAASCFATRARTSTRSRSARELNVKAVVTGRVTMRGDRLIIRRRADERRRRRAALGRPVQPAGSGSAGRAGRDRRRDSRQAAAAPVRATKRSCATRRYTEDPEAYQHLPAGPLPLEQGHDRRLQDAPSSTSSRPSRRTRATPWPTPGSPTPICCSGRTGSRRSPRRRRRPNRR